MNKKKLISMLAAVALVAAVGIGSTLAYFTDKADATNIITMGHVDIDLTEPTFDENTENTKEIENVTPGQEIVKDPTITVAKGSQDAYLRAKIGFKELNESQIADLTTKNEDGSYKYFDINTADWVLGADGYFYYQRPVSAKTSVQLFTKVTIPASWGNEVADKSFNIIVSAEAIQADNFNPEDENGRIDAWTVDGTAVTAETYNATVAAN